jgi:uncharacterized protein
MSQENVEIVRRSADALNRGDQEALLGIFAEDGVFEPLRAGVQGAYRGHEGIREFMADTVQSFDVFHVSFDDLRDLGGRVLAIGTIRVRGRGSGVEAEVVTAGIFTLRKAHVVQFKDFGDRKQALQAAGLSE